MKTLLFLLLLLSSIQAQNVWYVDMNNTSGNHDGRSWETAWRQLDSSAWAGNVGINWSVIGDGDTIYLSGGTDSTAYYPLDNRDRMYVRPGASGQEFNEQVVITKAWHPGHNGEVYITTHSDAQAQLLQVAGVHNVKFHRLNFVDRRVSPPSSAGMVESWGRKHVFDSCSFYSRSHMTGLGFSSSPPNNLPTDRQVLNCYFDIEENDNPGDLDPLGWSWGMGHYVFDNNTIILRNGNVGTSSHRDVIQMGAHGDSLGIIPSSVVISNNLIIDTRSQGTGWNAVIYMVGQMSANVYCYNNIIVFQKTNTSIAGYWFNGLDEHPLYLMKFNQEAFLFNNTTILKGNPASVNAVTSNGDIILAKNNIFVIDTLKGASNNGYVIGFGNPPPATPYSTYVDFDYNYYGVDDDDLINSTKNNFAVYGPFRSWNTWRSISNQDVNSTLVRADAITFANKYGLSREDYYTEAGRGMGVNLLQEHPELVAIIPGIMYDAVGNPRPQSGPWDIGALQYQGNPSNNINVQGKIFLQGPFNGNTMKTDLADSSFLPASQPYNNSPWNYSGSESLILPGGQPGSGYVDWVLVELRNSSNPVEVAGRRAAILRNDGMLLEPDGSVGVIFDNMQEGLYHIAVFHRNHLAVMSAVPVYLNSNSQLYDFTNEMYKAYGINPMVDIGNGNLALYSGDGNSNGGVNIHDKNGVWQLQNGTLGYLNGDFNLNGGVNIIDLNDFWNPNNGKEAQLPERE